MKKGNYRLCKRHQKAVNLCPMCTPKREGGPIDSTALGLTGNTASGIVLSLPALKNAQTVTPASSDLSERRRAT